MSEDSVKKENEMSEMMVELIVRVGRLEAKMDQMLALVQAGAAGQSGARDVAAEGGSILETLTVKQHAVLQMLLNGKGNAEIGERMGISENTAKVHVRLLAKKAGGHKRQQIVAKFKRAFDEFDEGKYQILTKGLPKNWDSDWGAGSEKFDHLLRND